MNLRVDKFAYSIGEPCSIHVLINDDLFIIRLTPNPTLIQTVEANYLQRLDAAQVSEDFSEQYIILQEIKQCVLNLLQLTFKELATTTHNSQPSNYTLHACLAPDTTILQLLTIDGSLQFRYEEAVPFSYTSRIQNVDVLRKDLPVFRPSEIIVLSKLRSTRVLKVLADQQVRCCKLAEECYPDLMRELQVLQEIPESDLGSFFRIPRLRGFVRSEHETGIIGYLMDCIEISSEISDLSSIKERVDTIDRLRRAKWASQAQDIVKKLHQLGLVWGDAKADNLLVDSHDDVWVIDLGGGRTSGWVSKKLQDSKEGDLEGLQLIYRFLKL